MGTRLHDYCQVHFRSQSASVFQPLDWLLDRLSSLSTSLMVLLQASTTDAAPLPLSMISVVVAKVDLLIRLPLSTPSVLTNPCFAMGGTFV